MHGIGKIDGTALLWKLFHLSPRSQRIDIRLVQFSAHTFQELSRIFDVLEGIDKLFQFLEEPGVTAVNLLALFIGPMGCNTFLGDPVHCLGTNLDLDEIIAGADHRCMHRLVIVGFRRRDEILDPAGNRCPVGMHNPQGFVALFDGCDNYPKGHLVIDLVQRDILGYNFFID